MSCYDALAQGDAASKKKSDIQYPINYEALDSIRFDVKTQSVFLYGGSVDDSIGGAHVEYGKIQMDAGLIIINWEKHTLTATYLLDSAGNKVGVPILNEDGDIYHIDSAIYNYETGKGYMSQILTPQNDGWMSGGKTFKDEENILFIEDGRFCPCDDPQAGTYIKANKIKVITEDEELDRAGKVITGPFLLHIADLPTPIGAPFGIFPTDTKKASGLVIPIYGEHPTRGFYLRNGGFYWATNDYIGLKFLGEIYSNGGWGGSLIANYKSRYRFSGNFQFNYRKVVRNGDEVESEITNDYKVNWQHSPVSLGNKKFTADVNLATTTYNTNNSINTSDYLSATLRSNIRYSQPIKGTPFSTSINLRHDQNNQTGITNFTLPDINLSMSRQYPFKFRGATGRKNTFKSFYESINVGYSMSLQNRISTNITSQSYGFDVLDEVEDSVYLLRQENFGLFIDNARFGIKHSVPVSATLKLGPFNINSDFSYVENWYPRSLTFNPLGDTLDDGILADTIVKVDTAGIDRSYSYSGGINMTTRVYGMYAFKGAQQRQIRHIITPTVGLRFSPDFSSEGRFAGNYETVRLNDSTQHVVSRFQGMLFAPSSASRSSRMTFGFGNIIEMKYKSKKDTSDEFTYVKLLENLSFNSSWDFAKDSLNLADISISANTNLLNKINIRGNASLNPYVFDTIDGSTVNINKFALGEEQSLGRITSYSFTASTNLNPDAFKRQYVGNGQNEEFLDYVNTYTNVHYVDFTIPWSLRLNYNIRVTRPAFTDATLNQSLTASGDVKLTPNWKVGYSASYDFTNKQIATPRVNIHRDLGCWEMSFLWVPFGPQTSYEFYINLKSAMLKDVVKFNRKNTVYDQ